MNWGRAKTILIFLFLIINLFLYGMLSEIDKGINTIDDNVLENAVKVANNRGIKINKGSITKNRFKNGNMELFLITAEPEKCAERFLGKNSECASFDVASRTYRYEKNGNVLEIKDNFLHFLSGRDKKDIKDEKNAAENAAADLKKFGIKRKNAKIVKSGTENGKNYIVVKPIYKGFDVEGFSLTVFYDGAGITEICGIWFDFADYSESETFLEDITAVISVLEGRDDAPDAEIVSADFAYFVQKEQLTGRYVTAIPTYTFKQSDEKLIVIDARTGKNIE
ncbi:MAG: hypothetical protein J6L59_00675 [Clostridia bacterium]|nr:hypothetical protein [Clostridia bacterium]